MIRTSLLSSTILLFVALGSGAWLYAADEPAPPPGRPTQEEIRERFKNLPPEERAARLKAIRDNGGIGSQAADTILKRRAELEKLREEIKDLPPKQREARLQEWREKNAAGRPAMTPEERETRRKLFQKRIEDQMAVLTKKKADGSITEEETRRLQSMELMHKRLELAPTAAPADSAPKLPLGLPLPSKPTGEPAKPSKPDEPAKR